jgi:hypothetical protein
MCQAATEPAPALGMPVCGGEPVIIMALLWPVEAARTSMNFVILHETFCTDVNMGILGQPRRYS